MDMTDAVLEELLGAYALDALEPDERVAVEALLARRPDLTREVDGLARAAVWIGATEAMEVPPGLRDSVLDRARRQRIDTDPDPAASAYAASRARLRDAMEALDPEDYEVATPNGLSARDLVVHLAAQDTLVAQAVGRTTLPDVTELDIDQRTERLVDRLREQPLDDVIALWDDAAEAVERWAREEPSATSTITWLGLDLPRQNVLVGRAFENWIHRDDLRRVIGREQEPPPATELRVMTELAVGTLPFGLVVTGNTRPGRVARLVLTGPGGGEWTIGMGGERVAAGAAPDVTIEATALDWCLVAGERLDPAAFVEAIAPGVTGDTTLLEPLVAAAPAFATL